ncbi:uncharacterized protein LOC143188671 [Calliopsis andreniformis]|uniref:uncharacterized protein LOC143188671 n=1 Tax=Calliopsis andreniformis TaxID=337506 RepID=UPI003FCE65EA
MGRKRSHREMFEEDNPLKKHLRRLERLIKKKYKKKRRARHRVPSPSSESSSTDRYSREGFLDPLSENSIGVHNNEKRAENPQQNKEDQIPGPSGVTTEDKVHTEASGDLSQCVLEVLGKRLDSEMLLGPALHKYIAVRWGEIAKQGLPKEESETLVKKYPIPENCTEFKAPMLNPEVKASLPEGPINRDERMVLKQLKLAACLSALGVGVSNLLGRGGSDHLPLLESLCDAARLLVDVQHEESRTRKALVLANLNVSVRETLNNTTIDGYLFGKKFEGHIKTVKSLEKTSKDLKPTTKS